MKPSRQCRRGFGSVVAVLLLAIGSIVIVGIATPGADRPLQSAYQVSSVRALLAADAGLSMAMSGVLTSTTPAVPTPLASDYDITFTDLSSPPGPTVYQINAKFDESTRVVHVYIEPY